MILLDTHVLIWWLSDKNKLSELAKKQIATAWQDGQIAISAMTLWEISLLVRKKRLELSMDVELWTTKLRALSKVVELPISGDIALRAVTLPNFAQKDPVDRLVVATALEHNLQLVTKDLALREYTGVKSIW